MHSSCLRDNDGGILRLSTYNIVYLNSKYTANWYRECITSERRNFVQRHGFAPTLPPVAHFPPPFELLRTSKQKDFRSVRIVLIGRFFDGRQGKHHLDAIKTFEKLSSSPSINKTSGDMSLTLVGNLATGQEKYLRKVRTAAKAVHGVKILVGIRRERLVSVLKDSNIVWSITGMDSSEADDPADAEHFGIALLEAMSTGMIPLVLNKGGPVEIVDQFPKYLQISTVTELAESTSRLLQNSLSDLRELSERARATARDMNIFHKEFDNIFNMLGIRLTPDSAHLWMHTNDKVRAIQNQHGGTLSLDICNEHALFTAKKAVVYMETRLDLALRANLMTLLSTRSRLGCAGVAQ